MVSGGPGRLLGMEYFTALISAIALVMSALSWRVSRRQADTSDRQLTLQEDLAHAAAAPNVWVDIQPDGQGATFHLVLCNDGPTLARNVRVNFSPSLRSLEDGWQMPLPPVMRSLPPGRRMSWFLDTVALRLDVECSLPTKYSVKVAFDGPFGPVRPLTYDLDLREYLGADIRTVSDGARTANEIHLAAVKISAALDKGLRRR